MTKTFEPRTTWTRDERQRANHWYINLREWKTHTVTERYGNPYQASSGFTIIGATRVPLPGTGNHRITYLQTPTGSLEQDHVITTIKNAPYPHRYILNALRTTTHPKALPAALLRPDTNAWTDSVQDIPAIARAVLWLADTLENNL